MLLLLGLMGCQQDLLRVMGAVTGIVVNPRPAGAVATIESEPSPPPPEVSALGVQAPVAAVDGELPAPPPPSPASYNPISMPEGPRESSGVRWEGVRGRADPDRAPRSAGTPLSRRDR